MRYQYVAVFLLVGLLGLPSAWAEDEKEGITPETAKARLDEAIASDSDEVMVDAIQQAAGIADPDVIAKIAHGFRSKSPAVVEAALLALGKTEHDDALQALDDLYWRVRGKKLRGNEDLFALLLREIGRHGHRVSLKTLTDKPFQSLTHDVGMARIMGLGNIRESDSVDALVMLTRQAGGRGTSGVVSAWRGSFRKAFRTAMSVLTGTDQGKVPADWDAWWRANRKDFVIPAKRPQVHPDVSDYWSQYWGVPYYEAGKEPPPPSLRSPIERITEPSDVQVKAAVEQLKAAFKSRDDDTIVKALEWYGGVLDRRVVAEVAKGLRSRSRTVKLATLDVLGWMNYDRALRQLHREFRRTKTKWTDDEDMFAALLKAVGRHGDKSSVKVLSESPFKALTLATGRARILGLANIRHRDAVESLMKGTHLAGEAAPRSWRQPGDKRFTDEFHTALSILTGKEMGKDLEEWRRWWRENRKTFKVSADRPATTDRMKREWEAFWNEPYQPREELPAGPEPDRTPVIPDRSILVPSPSNPNGKNWLKEGLDLRTYDSLIVEPIRVVLEEGSDAAKLDADTRSAAAEALRRIVFETVDPYYPVVAAPGPTVLRVRLALTDLAPAKQAPKKGDPPIEVGGAALEGAIFDSQSDEMLVAFVTRIEGSTSGQTVPEEWRPVEGAFREWAGRLLDFLDSYQE